MQQLKFKLYDPVLRSTKWVNLENISYQNWNFEEFLDKVQKLLHSLKYDKEKEIYFLNVEKENNEVKKLEEKKKDKSEAKNEPEIILPKEITKETIFAGVKKVGRYAYNFDLKLTSEDTAEVEYSRESSIKGKIEIKTNLSKLLHKIKANDRDKTLSELIFKSLIQSSPGALALNEAEFRKEISIRCCETKMPNIQKLVGKCLCYLSKGVMSELLE